jgi:hypothetical protein
MNDAPSPARLILGRGLRLLSLRMIQRTGELETYDFGNAAFTILTGPRNSSKTTTLKVIDYCLGNRSSAAEALGASIEEKYQQVQLDLAIDGVRHRHTRTFEHGLRGLIVIDDDLRIPVEEWSNWMLQSLGWPTLSIPLGRNAATATQLTPLTFRSMLRHIYRREDSWTEFAYKEEEYLRRAVISMFLGFAAHRYETANYELGRAQRKLAAAEAVYRDICINTDESVQALVQQLTLPPILGVQALEGVRRELQHRLVSAQSERQALTARAEDAVRPTDDVPGLDPALPFELEAASEEAADAAQRVAALRKVIEEHVHSRALVEADIARLHRMIDAVELFNELPVRICPVCEQHVDPNRPHGHGECYLCGQVVSEDIRRRRAEREERALRGELDDLDDVIAHTRDDLLKAEAVEAQAAQNRTRIAYALHDERVARLAPFMAALEDVATEIGRIEKQIAAIPALEAMFSRCTAAGKAEATAREEMERLTHIVVNERRDQSAIMERCATFAERMNEFVKAFQTRAWVEGGIAISADDLTFYVGTRPWDDTLGAEARVLFFMAYCYALLHLDHDFGRRACPPGVLLLDNPYQQGVRIGVVAEAISRLGDAANRNGVQLILTQSRSAANLTMPHSEIRMGKEYTF